MGRCKETNGKGERRQGALMLAPVRLVQSLKREKERVLRLPPEAMTAPRAREQADPPSPPDRLPPRRGGRPSLQRASAGGGRAVFSCASSAWRGLLRCGRPAAAGALLCILGALALPAAAQTDRPMSVPVETEPVCRPLPSGPPAPTCDGGNEGGVILVGGSAPSEGSVRICHDNEFRSVCDDFFTNRGAGVACRQLGYPTGVPTYRSHFVGDAGPVSYWLDDVNCSGTEANLGDCPHPGWGRHNCVASERVGVICTTRVTGIYAVGGERQVSLSWDAPPSRYDRGITGHEYRYKTRGEDGYGPWQPIPDSAPPQGETGKNFDSYTVTGLTKPGTVYSFQVRIVGGGHASEPATASVRTAGEANRLPEFGGPAARSVAENSAAGSAVGAPVTATDADGDTLRYSLEAVDDHASFTIDSSSGQIETRAAHDHEARSRYAVTVKAADGAAGSDTVAVTIEIADVEEQPTDAEIVTDPESDGVWSAGEQVEARVQFGVPVRVTLPAGGRAPELLLAFYGGGGRVGSFGRAAYTGGSETGTLSFAYTVTQADAGAGSVLVPRNALRSGDASIEPASAARALQGRFVSPPERHDGKKRIKVRVEFSEPVAESPENVGEHGVDVEGGQVTSVRPVGSGNAPGGAGTRSVGGGNAGPEDREVVWEFEIEPDSDGDVTVSLDAGRPCDEPGAICTADGRSLSEGIATTVEGPTGPPPLTASFEDMPEAHDGERAFRFRVAFSEPIAISFRSLREDAFAVSGGRVTRGTRVDRRKDLFEITVEPDGAGEVTISLPAGRECSVSGAICTWGPPRKPLTNTPTAPVAGPAEERAPALLTASFEGVPSEHDGERAFTLRIAFTEPLSWMNGRRLREDVVAVAGGRATKASRVNRRRDLWQLTVEPDSLADVTVTLAAGAACRTPAAVCTSDGRALSTTIATTVRGPVAVSVADARAEEGTDATLDFAVTLSRAASGPVAVAYATADGTATAGSDYTARKGQLTFDPGETATTVRVPVLDDAHDEGEETLTLRLSAASGAVLADGTATGTIVNSDKLQRAWLARFGRTVATHVTDAVGDRLRGAPGQDSHLTVGGYRLPVGQRDADGAEPATQADSLASLMTGLAGVLGLGPGQTGGTGVDPGGGGLGWDAWPDAGRDPRLGQSQSVNLNLRRLLLGSSFRLAFGRDDAGASRLRLTAWGRVAGTTFGGRDGDLSLNGDVLTGTVGVDGEWDRLLAGLAVAHSRGDGSYTMPGNGKPGQGELETTLTSVHPYLRYAVTDRLAVWGLLGFGTGQMELEVDTDEIREADTDLLMGAFGGRGILLAAPESGGFQLATRTDAMLTRTTSDGVVGMESAEADAHRLRLVLEGSRGFTWAEGRRLTPTMEVGLRHDWGDAETGFGLELGGRVQYADPALGLTIDATVRGLLAHEDDDYQEWGASGTVRITPGAMGQGLSLTLAPAWGATASGVDGLWSRQTTAGLAPQGTRQTPAGRLNAEVGYGFAPFDTGLLTPYAGTVLSDGADRTYRVGTRLQLGGPGATGLNLNLEGTRQEPAGQQPANQGLRFQLTWGF